MKVSLWKAPLLCLALTACASLDGDTGALEGLSDSEVGGGAPQELVFREPFENVWRAGQLAVARYPIKVNDMDSGVLETDNIKGDLAWNSPHLKRPPAGGRRYKLNIRILKGKVGGNAPGTKVIVSKRIDIQRDFFSPSESKPSDGLEEISILYRMQRELEVEKFLKKNRQRAKE
jgi:hypothetical protein